MMIRGPQFPDANAQVPAPEPGSSVASATFGAALMQAMGAMMPPAKPPVTVIMGEQTVVAADPAADTPDDTDAGSTERPGSTDRRSVTGDSMFCKIPEGPGSIDRQRPFIKSMPADGKQPAPSTKEDPATVALPATGVVTPAVTGTGDQPMMAALQALLTPSIVPPVSTGGRQPQPVTHGEIVPQGIPVAPAPESLGRIAGQSRVPGKVMTPLFVNMTQMATTPTTLEGQAKPVRVSAAPLVEKGLATESAGVTAVPSSPVAPGLASETASAAVSPGYAPIVDAARVVAAFSSTATRTADNNAAVRPSKPQDTSPALIEQPVASGTTAPVAGLSSPGARRGRSGGEEAPPKVGTDTERDHDGVTGNKVKLEGAVTGTPGTVVPPAGSGPAVSTNDTVPAPVQAHPATSAHEPAGLAARRPAEQVTLQFSGEQGLEGSIRVAVRGGVLHAAISAAEPGTAARLQDTVGELRQALAERGFNDAQISVHRPVTATTAGAEHHESGSDSHQRTPDQPADPREHRESARERFPRQRRPHKEER